MDFEEKKDSSMMNALIKTGLEADARGLVHECVFPFSGNSGALGVQVKEMVKGGAVQVASDYKNLKKGDTIIACNQEQVTSLSMLTSHIKETRSKGGDIRLHVMREKTPHHESMEPKGNDENTCPVSAPLRPLNGSPPKVDKKNTNERPALLKLCAKLQRHNEKLSTELDVLRAEQRRLKSTNKALEEEQKRVEAVEGYSEPEPPCALSSTPGFSAWSLFCVSLSSVFATIIVMSLGFSSVSSISPKASSVTPAGSLFAFSHHKGTTLANMNTYAHSASASFFSNDDRQIVSNHWTRKPRRLMLPSPPIP